MSQGRGGLGCLGVLALLAQALASAGLVAALLWLDPAWFDGLAFWRSSRLPTDAVSWNSPRAPQAAALEETPELPPAPPPDPLETSQERAVSVPYDPARGALLAAPDGARLEFPPGALAESSALRLAPVTWLPPAMAGPVTGPLYELRIGAQEHATFGRAVTVSLPYREELFPGSAPVVGVFETGGWRQLPSRVDRERRVVTAELPHASVLGVLNPAIPAPVAGVLVGGAALAAAGYVVSANERELLWQSVFASSGCDQVKETSHFVIHSCASGEHAAEPGLVDELAEPLERTFSGLGTVGTPVPPYTLRKYHVFVGRTKSYGDTAPGGPVFFNARLRALLAADDLRVAPSIKAVVAHELAHVAQERFFGTIAAHRYAWWLEASAAYLGDLYWDQQDQPTDMVAQRYVRAPQGRLSQTPMELTEDPEHYGYGSLLRFLDQQKPGAGLAFVQAVNAGGDASLSAIDGAARKATGEGLPTLFTRWAQAFHHDDLWSGTLAPRLHRGKTPLSAALTQTNEGNAREFAAVTEVRGGRTVVNTWALSSAVRVKHLSAVAFAMDIGPLERKAKLVVRADRLGGSSQLELWLASGTLGGTLPGKGARGAFAKLAGDSGVVEGVQNPGGIDRVTLLAVNPSLTDDDLRGLSVDRWLLLPPKTVRFERDKEPLRTWTVTWDRVELKDSPQAFRAYNVYRRKVGQPATEWLKVKEGLTDEVYTDHPEEDAAYDFTVRTVDQLGNESEYADSANDDPFAGDWSGVLRLIEGDFARPLMRVVREIAAPDGEASPKTEAQLRDIQAIVDKAQHALRMGLPVEFSLRPRAGGYTITVKRLGMLVDGQPSPLRLLGPNTLGPEKWDGTGEPPLFRRTREDEIREDGYSRTEQIGQEVDRYTLSWKFERVNR